MGIRVRDRILATASFLKNVGWGALSLASGGPTVILALWFYLKGKQPPQNGLPMLVMGCSVAAAWLQWLRDRRAHQQEASGLRERIQELEGNLAARLLEKKRKLFGLLTRIPLIETQCYFPSDGEAFRSSAIFNATTISQINGHLAQVESALPDLFDLADAIKLHGYRIRSNSYADDPSGWRAAEEAYKQQFVPLQEMYRVLKREVLG